MTKKARAYVNKPAAPGSPANYARMKVGPKGAGRPSEQFPEKYRTMAVEMFRDKHGVDSIRKTLCELGYNISVRAISAVVTPAPTTLAEIVKPMEKRVEEAKNLSSTFFTGDMREIVDDFLTEGKDPSAIHDWLVKQGMTPTLAEVVAYCIFRQEELAKLPQDPISAEIRRLGQHIRSTRAKLFEVWNGMPLEKRYSEKTFVALLGELRFAQTTLIEEMRKSNEASAAAHDIDSGDIELREKLGLLEQDEPPMETLN